MSGIGPIAALAVVAALCAVVVRKQAPEIALVLTMAAGAVMLWACARAFSAVLEFLEGLAQTGGLSGAIVLPVIKVAGIGLVTRIAAEICRDAKEGGLAGAVETAGTLTALLAALPLLSAVLGSLTELM